MEENKKTNIQKYALTVNEARECIGVGQNTMYQLVKRPDFPTLRINRKILIPVKEFESWISKNVGKF